MEENEKLKLDEKYMRAAIKQAQKAYAINETPIGCVIVYEGKIIGRGYNRRNTDKDPLAHAEIKAIKKASKKMGDWRLEQCTMYVTLEPCQMCAGAIIQSRLTRVVVGCMNPKAGCAGSVLNLLDIKQFNHQAELTTGALRGMGYSAIPMLLSIIGTVGTRIVWIFMIFPRHRSLDVLFISYPASWLITIILQVICYFFVRKRIHNPLP